MSLAVVVLAAAIAVFVTYPQPNMDWEGEIYPAAQRYMEEYHHAAAVDQQRNEEEDDTTTPTVDPNSPLKGLVVAITGPTAGIGLALTRRLYEMGAHVIAIGRSPTKLQSLQDELEGSANGMVSTVVADLSDLDSVAQASKNIIESYDHIDILFNNAGLHTSFRGMMSLETTKQGYDLAFGVNYLSHFLLTEKLKPLLGKSPGKKGKIIQISSSFHGSVAGTDLEISAEKNQHQPLASLPGGHHGFFFFRSQRQYSNSKLAQILHARALNRNDRLPNNVRASSICPSWVGTDIGGKKGTFTNSALSVMAFPVDFWGLSSVFAAMFYNHTASTTSETKSSHHIHDLDDYFVNTKLLGPLYSDPPIPSWLSTATPLMDVGGALGAFGYIMPCQRFAARTSPIRSSYCSYDGDLQDGLYEWSLQAVKAWL